MISNGKQVWLSTGGKLTGSGNETKDDAEVNKIRVSESRPKNI